ncbi:SDR family oxidoreductase [Aureibacter tunicatorum]|uniref:3-oxoacyl-[acyl-carrier protein] reductase n=1 Tax=Aureibacter tunicatorum TaxID=866807 RepID=A0AAE4BP52_9BACT|nr:SDR family oxidoreductase [Aureibacter tunicatorum]MDR6237579.1 3-oxoacyl-[acyl-carrier protein] reductase [Aureibacter tunicatorum]BDD02613.1 short-chain dehydrogenase [Aureibacter tunicatorum]
MNLDLKGRTALVCGASGGIGRSIAKELADLGARVVLFARNREKLEEVKLALNDSFGQIHGLLVADFDNIEQVEEQIDGFLSKEGQVDILVNNSGGPSPGPVFDAGIEEFEIGFRRLLLIAQLLTQKAVPHMKQAKYGRVINIVSTSVRVPIAGLGVSNTIRGAVAGWAKTMANELGPYGITVNNILPGMTDTDRLRSLVISRAEDSGESIKEVEKSMLSKIPAGRFGDPKETAYAAGFLASPSASFINGVNLPVDGGQIPSI